MSSIDLLEELVVGSSGNRLGPTLEGLNLSSLTIGTLTVTTINGQSAANLVFSNTTQTISGVKTFTSPITITRPATGIANPVYTYSSTTVLGTTSPVEIMYQDKAFSNDVAPTTVSTVNIPANTTVLIEAVIVARRTGGASGTAEDGGGFIWYGTFKNVAGTATVIAAPILNAMSDQPAWTIGYAIAGAAVEIQATAAAANDVMWTATIRYWISSA
ncbi:YapH protein [Faustovirus]|nr:YapH protein [Faustovirus]